MNAVFLFLCGFWSITQITMWETIDTVSTYGSLKFNGHWNNAHWCWNEILEKAYINEINKPLASRKELKVVVVPFSHNDAGWLLTFENYYDTKTKFILDNIANSLTRLHGMKFSWSEMCFLQRWWDRAAENKKRNLRCAILSNQLEIVTGGWVMPDEAVTHYYSLIDQLVEGHQWLHRNLEVHPSTSWSIDPFGLSSTMPYLLWCAHVRDGLVIQRIHYAWKKWFSDHGALDLKWCQDWDPPGDPHCIPLKIQSSPSYSVTSSCGPSTFLCPMFDFTPVFWNAPNVSFCNVFSHAETLLGQYGRLGSLTEENTALVTLGDDFRFDTAEEMRNQYVNYKALFDFINANKNHFGPVNVKFGTPKDYFLTASKKTPRLIGDFFVYSDFSSSMEPNYWSGFYTTRPVWKKRCRLLQSRLRSAEILYTIALNTAIQRNDSVATVLKKLFQRIVKSRRNLGLFQHHDSITGTSRSHVMKDYCNKFLTSMNCLERVINQCMSYHLRSKSVIFISEESLLVLPKSTNVSTCVVLYNSLACFRDDVVTISVDQSTVEVFDASGKSVCCQSKIVNSECSGEREKYELTFQVHLPPLSLQVYTILYNPKAQTLRECCPLNFAADFFWVENPSQSLKFSHRDGTLKCIKKCNLEIQVNIDFIGYYSCLGDGAYVFKTELPADQITSKNPKISVTKGPLFTEVNVCHGPLISTRTRIYNSKEWIGKIIEYEVITDFNKSPNDQTDLNIVVRFSTSLGNTLFFTDVNGFQERRRIFNRIIGVEGNFYPMVCRAFIENKCTRFSIISDRSHGVASLLKGSIEVMIDRRMRGDDGKGLMEGVTDNTRTVTKFYLHLGKVCDGRTGIRKLSNFLDNSILTAASEEPKFRSVTFLKSPVSCNLRLINMRTIQVNKCQPTQSMLMTVHNVGNSSCCLGKLKLAGLKYREHVKTSLSGTKDLHAIRNLNVACVKPMNIDTIKVSFIYSQPFLLLLVII